MSNKNRGKCLACRVDHIEATLYEFKGDGNLYCIRHWNQMYRVGKITSVEKIHGMFKPNKIHDKGEYIEMGLFDRSGNEIARTAIDKDDYGKIKSYRWFISRRGYVRTKFMRKGKWYRHRLHTFLLGKRDGFVVDHRDGDSLNNRKGNLRHATYEQNSWNNSNIKKYTAYKVRDMFQCEFRYRGQVIRLGRWDTRKEAIDIAEKFQTFLHGEYGYDKSRS